MPTISRRTALAAALMLAAAAPLPLAGQGSTAPVPVRAAADARATVAIAYLAADAREGRGVGTAGLDSAAAYVARAFRDAGLRPGGTTGYFQPFTIDSTAPAAAHSGLGGAHVKNVIGLLPGNGPLAGQVLVIGAHYDHLGLGGFGAMDPDSTGKVHNGADDNASGTVGLIEIARRLATQRGGRRTIEFIAFTGEELGTLGSDYYVKHPMRPIDSTYAMLNLDMVGRLRNDRLLVFGTASAKELGPLVDSLAAGTGLTVLGSGDGWGPSDHASFYAAHLPVLHFFTDTHEDYHRTTDDAAKVNSDGIVRIAWYAADIAAVLARRPARLTFVEVARPAPMAGGYGAYLGSQPDMSSSPGGVRLTGVTAGSPADKAGIKAGDIITKIGDHVVANLYDMTDALRSFKPGDTVTIIVLREGQPVSVSATLGKRGG
jgi:Zn-dependent M28 family amino/carboxypeptidase